MATGRYMTEFGCESVTLLCGQQIVVNRVGVRGVQAAPLRKAVLLRRALHMGLSALQLLVSNS